MVQVNQPTAKLSSNQLETNHTQAIKTIQMSIGMKLHLNFQQTRMIRPNDKKDSNYGTK